MDQIWTDAQNANAIAKSQVEQAGETGGNKKKYHKYKSHSRYELISSVSKFNLKNYV